MSKTILADVDGFTPIIDDLAKEYGLMRAAVFGRMWRFCQMSDNVCRASLDTIAEGLGVDKATVMRHAQELVSDGYLKDLTPEKRNSPHVYQDTGKAGIKISVGVAGSNAKPTVAECNATVAQRNATVAESKLKIVSKKESKKQKDDDEDAPPKFSKPFLEYERNIGALVPMLKEELDKLIAETSEAAVLHGITQAVGANARNLRYIAACAQKHHAGVDVSRQRANVSRAPQRPARMSAADEWLRRETDG